MSELTERLGNKSPKKEKLIEFWDAVLVVIVIIFIAFVIVKTIKINNIKMAEFSKAQQREVKEKAQLNKGIEGLLREK